MVIPKEEQKDNINGLINNEESTSVSNEKERKTKNEPGTNHKKVQKANNDNNSSNKRRGNGGSNSASKKEREKKIPVGKSVAALSKINTEIHENVKIQSTRNMQSNFIDTKNANISQSSAGATAITASTTSTTTSSSTTTTSTTTAPIATSMSNVPQSIPAENKSVENSTPRIEDKNSSGIPTMSRNNSVDKNIYRLQRRNSKSTLLKPTPHSESKGKLLNIKKSWQKLKAAKIVAGTSHVQAPNSNSTDPSLTNTDNNTTDSEKTSKPVLEKTSKNDTGKSGQTENSNAVQNEKVALGLPQVTSSKKDHAGTDSENDKNALLPRDSTQLSLDASSQISFDPVIQSTAIRYQQEEKPKSVISNNDSWIRSAIPFLPIGLSILCLILNILIPGSGTVLSGFSILFCGRTRVQTKDDQIMVTLCVNICVGVSQLFTVTFLFVGWFWSLAWGIKMVSLSVEYKLQKKQVRERELQTLALSAFGSQVHVRPQFSLV